MIWTAKVVVHVPGLNKPVKELSFGTEHEIFESFDHLARHVGDYMDDLILDFGTWATYFVRFETEVDNV